MKFGARTWIYGLFLLVALIGAAYTWGPQEAPPSSKPSKATKTPAAKINGEPLPDVASQAKAPDALVVSKWLGLRAARYRELLRTWQCDLLVVPIQVESQGFDRATRQLMSADLAQALSANNGCVVPPSVVDIALGEGLRRRRAEDVTALARELKAKVVLSTYAGHDRDRHMRVTMRLEQLNAGSSSAPIMKSKASFDDMVFTDQISPFDVFHENLPRMLKGAGLEARTASQKPAGQLGKELPESPKALLATPAKAPIEQAARLTLLGMLAPANESPAGERAFAKAWLTLSETADDPTVLRMRARILFHLRQRPYALDRLRGLSGPEADALRAAINGNLPALQTNTEKVREPWERLFLDLETYDLQHRYQRDADATAVAIVGALGPEWDGLGSARLADSDQWLVPDLVKLKQSLDETFPIPHQSLEELVKGNFVIAQAGDPSGYDLLAGKHVETLLQSDPRKWCCVSFDPAMTAFDLLDVYDARITSSLVSHVSFYANVQANYERALDLLSKYEEQLLGNPYAEEIRARVEWTFLKRGEIAGRDARNERIRAAARIAVVADPGQTPPPAAGLWYLLQPPEESLAHILGDAYCEDFPVRSDWPGMPFTTRNRLLFSSSDIGPFKELLKESKGDARKELLSELDSRFSGDATATNLRLDELVEKGRLDPAIVRDAISADPDNWDLYRRLAVIHARRGEYEKAAEVTQSFPGFSRTTRRTVELSNHAEYVASVLYYSGAIDAARPLLKIAADYDNGSSASIEARAHLAVLDGDFATAAMAFLASARRYNQLEDYRDYLGLLFASGKSTDAWAGFDQLVRKFQGAQPWTAALVGHRRDNTTQAELRQWILAKAADSARPRGDQTVATYAMLEQLTDRGMPEDGFVDFIARVAGPSNVKAGSDGKSFKYSVAGEKERRVGPSPFGQERRAIATKDAVIPNAYPLLAEAWLALRQKRYDAAAQAFDRLASYYDIESSGYWSFVLPYFAIAAVQSGDELELEKHFESTADHSDGAWGQPFARAVFQAAHGHHDEASRLLDDVFHDRPDSGGWPVSTAFEYADICVWLSEITHDDRYRQRALAWARKHRKIEPTRAWAHALTAWVSTDEHERVEAMAMAIHLDPQSEWAKQVPAVVRDKAAVWLKTHSLFRFDSPEEASRKL